MYVGPARTSNELDDARRLAGRVLEANATAAEARDHKSFLWSEPGFPGLDHVVVVTTPGGEVQAVVRLLPRCLRRQGERFKVAGVSSVCVVETHRKRGLGRLVMEAALEQARKLGYEVTALFARRAVDHLYTRFDIWGLASYSKLAIAPAAVGEQQDGAVTVRALEESDIPTAARWHSSCYRDCFGWFERSLEEWSFLRKRAQRRQMSLVVAETGGVAMGYAVLQSTRVVEIGFEETADAKPMLRALVPTQALVDLPPRHVLLSRIHNLDLTVSSRRCEYGGHMVGVIDRAAVCRHLATRIVDRARALQLAPCDERIDGLTLRWDGQKAHVALDLPPGQQQLGLAATARLLGAHLAAAGSEHSILAPAQSLDFLALDEF
jgi:L-amino acid N-acyltransferase YncA